MSHLSVLRHVRRQVMSTIVLPDIPAMMAVIESFVSSVLLIAVLSKLYSAQPRLGLVFRKKGINYATVNRFLIRNSLPSTKPKADAKCTLCCYRRPSIFYKFLNNKGSIFSQPRHGVHWKRHVYCYSTTCSPQLYALPTRSYAPPKLECSFCRTLYYANIFAVIILWTSSQTRANPNSWRIFPWICSKTSWWSYVQLGMFVFMRFWLLLDSH